MPLNVDPNPATVLPARAALNPDDLGDYWASADAGAGGHGDSESRRTIRDGLPGASNSIPRARVNSWRARSPPARASRGRWSSPDTASFRSTGCSAESSDRRESPLDHVPVSAGSGRR